MNYFKANVKFALSKHSLDVVVCFLQTYLHRNPMEVQMDNVDFPAAYRAARPDQGWTPLRDAIAAVLKPLQARIARAVGSTDSVVAPSLDDAPEQWLPAGHDYCERLMAGLHQPEARTVPIGVGAVEVLDSAGFHAAIGDIARDEPGTVSQARALLADPHAALAEPEAERQVAWLVALADLQHRRAVAAKLGGTAA